MKRSTLRLIVSLAIVLFLGWVVLFNSSSPRVLVLQSVSPDSDWGIRIDQGIQTALRANRQPITVITHYMNLDEAGSDTGFRVAVAAARAEIANHKPDVLIAVDDESNALVASQLPAQDRPAIVYTAILQSPEAYGYSTQTLATGIEESVPLAAIFDLLRTVMGDRPLKIAALGVDDLTGRAELARLLQVSWRGHTLVSSGLVTNFAQWQAFVSEQASEADVLLVLSTEMLGGSQPDEFLPEQTVIEWTETNARALPIGIRHSFVRYGGSLAVVSPPRVYGRLAMQMSIDWIAKGLETDMPAPRTVTEFNIAFRQTILKNRGIELPPVYRELARATDGLYP